MAIDYCKINIIAGLKRYYSNTSLIRLILYQDIVLFNHTLTSKNEIYGY